jgi:uncharacterized lipoprotein YbaY
VSPSQVARLGVFVLMSLLSAQATFGQSWMSDIMSAIPRIGTPTMGPSTTGASWDTTGGMGSFNPGMPSNMRQDWRIGVGIENRDTGALVTQVQPGSAAQQAGIMVGDIIVGAGPLRLGVVDNRIVELADVARKYADNYGSISMLVQDSRSGRLRSVSVNMTSTASSFSGSLVTRDGTPLPQGSMATVELKNISRPFFEVQGGRVSLAAAGYGPHTFTLNLDPRYLSPTDQYELQAAIFVGNQIAYTAQPVRIRPTDLSQPINLSLDRVGIPSSGGGAISAGYPNMAYNQNNLYQELLRLLGRQPNNNEVGAWLEFLNSGNSIDVMRQRILASPTLRNNFSSDPAYLQHVYNSVKQRSPSQSELSYWVERLRSTNNPGIVVNEMIQQR